MSEREMLEKAIANVSRHIAVGGTPVSITLDLCTVHAAARAHLDTLPRTKMVEVWHVEYASDGGACIELRESQEAAELAIRVMTNPLITCKRITGPHKHEVPA